MGVKIVWHICQNCLTKVLTLWTFLLDKIWLSKLAVIFVKIVWHKFWQFDTFVRENIAVNIVWHVCLNFLTHVLTLMTLLSDKILLSKMSDIFVKIVWHVFWHYWRFCQTNYCRQICLTNFLTFLTVLSDKILLSKLYDIFVKIVWHMYFTSETFIGHFYQTHFWLGYFCQTKYCWCIAVKIVCLLTLVFVKNVWYVLKLGFYVWYVLKNTLLFFLDFFFLSSNFEKYSKKTGLKNRKIGASNEISISSTRF